jgi:hypothetical protein
MGPNARVNIVSAVVMSGVPSGSNVSSASLHGVGPVGAASVVVGAFVDGTGSVPDVVTATETFGADVRDTDVPTVGESFDEQAPSVSVNTVIKDMSTVPYRIG